MSTSFSQAKCLEISVLDLKRCCVAKLSFFRSDYETFESEKILFKMKKNTFLLKDLKKMILMYKLK